MNPDLLPGLSSISCTRAGPEGFWPRIGTFHGQVHSIPAFAVYAVDTAAAGHACNAAVSSALMRRFSKHKPTWLGVYIKPASWMPQWNSEKR